MTCALCPQQARAGSKLCSGCDDARLAAASADRIARGTGLTRSNMQRFSEENWIAACKGDEAR
jgi:hypothetical protein